MSSSGNKCLRPQALLTFTKIKVLLIVKQNLLVAFEKVTLGHRVQDVSYLFLHQTACGPCKRISSLSFPQLVGLLAYLLTYSCLKILY